MEPWLLVSTRISWIRISGHQFIPSNSNSLGLCSRTVINKHKSASKCLKKIYICDFGVHTKIRLRCLCDVFTNCPILHRTLDQNVSTVTWKTHWQFLLPRVEQPLVRVYFINYIINEKLYFLYLLRLSLCSINMFWMIWYSLVWEICKN